MHSAAPGVISPCRWTISCLSSRATRTANSDRKFEIECTLLPRVARSLRRKYALEIEAVDLIEEHREDGRLLRAMFGRVA